MAYPGDPGLDLKIQQRILSAFGEAVRLYQEGSPEECRTILRSILEVDPSFSPGSDLMTAVDKGAPVDLGQLLGQITAAGGAEVESNLLEARRLFSQRQFASARAAANAVLRELPGHEEAKRIAAEAQTRLQAEGEVARYVEQAKRAMREGSTREVEAFLDLARNLDPSHPGIAELEAELEPSGGGPVGERPAEFEFTPAPAAQRPVPHAAPPPAAPPRMAAPPTPSAPGAPAEDLDDTATVAAAAAAGPPAAFQVDEDELVPAMDGDEDQQFEFGSAEVTAPEPSVAQDAATSVRELLDEGQAAFDRGDYQVAIDTWSRVYLVEPDNAEAEEKLEEARRRREEIERQAEHRFYEAREAFEHGRLDDARALCQKVLELQPQHVDAHDLLARLDTPSAPPPPPVVSAEDEDDIFRDDFVAAPPSEPTGVPARAAAPVEPGTAARAGRTSRAALPGFLSRVPLPVVAVVGALAIVLLVIGVLLRGTLFSGSGQRTESTLAQADEAARAGRLKEAVDLLSSLRASEDLEGDAANRVAQRLMEYKKKLNAATAARAPKVDPAPIRQAIADGERLKALRMIREGLVVAPNEDALATLRDEILKSAPALSSVSGAIASGDLDNVRRACDAALASAPGDQEIQRVWRAATFNFAVEKLRKYQVGAAKSLLDELRKRGDDGPDVQRLLEFTGKYSSRPVDPRYEIFVTNVELRPLE